MISTRDIIWLAGLTEGEGSFYLKDTPTLAISMTDEDVIVRAAKIIGVEPRKPWRSKLGNHKLVYSVIICGTRAISWMMTLFTLMGERRQAKIAEIIEAWKKLPNTPRAPRGQRFMATCHPDKPRQGGGLCNTCYMKAWRHRTGRNTNYYRKQAKLAAQEA